MKNTFKKALSVFIAFALMSSVFITFTVCAENNKLVKLEVNNNNISMQVGSKYSVSVTAVYGDNTKKSVTDQAQWSIDAKTVISVEKGGITALLEGKAVLKATYEGKMAVINVKVAAVPKTKPTFTPKPKPSAKPIFTPKPKPSAKPTFTPKPKPSAKPTFTPKPKPSAKPIFTPKPQPSAKPIYTPKPQPSAKPIFTPKPQPSAKPIYTPKPQPSAKPIFTPKPQPSAKPIFTPKPKLSATPMAE